MLVNRIDLYEYFSLSHLKKDEKAGFLNCYVIERTQTYPNRLRSAMMVFAGGGYRNLSDREKECIAFTYLAEGMSAFTLDYSLAPVKYPYCLLEACMAMLYIRENAEALGLIEDKVGVIGFSAGGHLAGMLSLIPDEKEIVEILGERVKNCRPNATVYSYPVVTSGEKIQIHSFVNLCGEDMPLRERLSLEKRVTKQAPPAFIWATADDGVVPSENSLMLAMAYKEQNVSFELHIYERGEHGLSLCTKEVNSESPAVKPWVKSSLDWLKRQGFEARDS